MEQQIEKVKELIKSTYKQYATSWTARRSAGNSNDCFDNGYVSGQSWLAYEIGILLGMELEKPEEPDYDDYD